MGLRHESPLWHGALGGLPTPCPPWPNDRAWSYNAMAGVDLSSGVSLYLSAVELERVRALHS